MVHTPFLIAQLVIDVAGELGSRRGARVENYKQAIRNLSGEPGFPSELPAQLEPLAGFRNIVVHEYIERPKGYSWSVPSASSYVIFPAGSIPAPASAEAGTDESVAPVSTRKPAS